MTGSGRTSIKGKHARRNQFTQRSYTYGFKHAVLEDYTSGATIHQLRVRYFRDSKNDVVRRMVWKWKQQRELIASKASNSSTCSDSRYRDIGLGTALSATIEGELVRWINDLRQDGVPVSASMLRIRAVELAESSGIAVGQFTATNSWKMAFLARHRLAFRTKNRAGQTSPDIDSALSTAFAAEVRSWMREYGVERIYNADQTAVAFEMLPKKTVTVRGVQTVWVKCGRKEKQRATAMLFADSDGNKYETFLVFKTGESTSKAIHQENVEKRHGFSKQLWTEVTGIQDAYGTQVYGNRAAWWNSSLTLTWLKYFFGDRTVSSDPVLLLLDSFSGHWTSDVVAYAASVNVIMKPVPPKLTWRSQPADVAWMNPIKDKLRGRWVEYLRQQLKRRKSSSAFLMVSPCRGDVAEWLVDGWLGLHERTIISGFRRCGFIGDGQRAVADECSENSDHADVTDLVEQLERCGLLDSLVGEVDSSMDLVDSITEAVV
jgi:hypothetical protein